MTPKPKTPRAEHGGARVGAGRPRLRAPVKPGVPWYLLSREEFLEAFMNGFESTDFVGTEYAKQS